MGEKINAANNWKITLIIIQNKYTWIKIVQHTQWSIFK